MTTTLDSRGLFCQLDNFGLEPSKRNIIHMGRSFSGKYEFSLEMTEFLWAVYEGDFDRNSDSHLRSLEVAGRLSCYNPQLFYPSMGAFSEFGYDAAIDARILRDALLKIYGLDFKSKNASKMDQIIPWGNLSTQAIKMLLHLWEMTLDADKPPLDYIKPVNVANWRTEVIEYDGHVYLAARSIRSNSYARNAAENLIKFGLVSLTKMHKSEASKGRGRAPIGLALTDLGKMFFVDYANTYNLATSAQTWQARSERDFIAYRDAAPGIKEWMSGKNPIATRKVPIPIVDDFADDHDHGSNVDLDADSPDAPRVIPPENDYTRNIPGSTGLSNTTDSSDVSEGENLRDLFGG